MLTLVRDGELHAPEPRGRGSVLCAAHLLAQVGAVDERAVRALGLPLQVLEADADLVVPGFVDPHEHFLGAGGESGYASRQPRVPLGALLRAGITCAVGCLGTDTTTRSLPALVGRARQLREGGVHALVYTGGWALPPLTLTGGVQEDLVLVDLVVGVGEVALSDVRGSQPGLPELARLVAAARVGGKMAGKAGVTHFHMGPGRAALAPLRALLQDYELEPRALYPTHVNRTEALLAEAVALSQAGCYVDMDTVEEGLGGWVRRYLEQGGVAERLTVSSDAHTAGATPAGHQRAFAAAVREEGLALEAVLPLFTLNPAAALGLDGPGGRGRLAPGAAADVVVLERGSLRVRHVVSGGRVRVRDGEQVTPVEVDAEEGT